MKKNLLIVLALLVSCKASDENTQDENAGEEHINKEMKSLLASWTSPISIAAVTMFSGTIWQGSAENRVFPPLKWIARATFECFGREANHNYLKKRYKPKADEPYISTGYAEVNAFLDVNKSEQARMGKEIMRRLCIEDLKKEAKEMFEKSNDGKKTNKKKNKKKTKEELKQQVEERKKRIENMANKIKEENEEKERERRKKKLNKKWKSRNTESNKLPVYGMQSMNPQQDSDYDDENNNNIEENQDNDYI